MYALIDLAKPIDLDDDDLIEYFVNGIPDSKSNKALLCQPRTMNQLKAQMGHIKTCEEWENHRLRQNITSTQVKINHKSKKSSARNQIKTASVVQKDEMMPLRFLDWN